MQEYFDGNRNLWNQWTKIHFNSDFYDVDFSSKEKSQLTPLN